MSIDTSAMVTEDLIEEYNIKPKRDLQDFPKCPCRLIVTVSLTDVCQMYMIVVPHHQPDLVRVEWTVWTGVGETVAGGSVSMLGLMRREKNKG